MREAILAIALGAIFVWGWRLMGRLDAFLLSNRRAIQPAIANNAKDILYVGVADSLMADVAQELEKMPVYTQSQSTVQFFSGSEAKLLEELAAHQLDMVFLSDSAAVEKEQHYDMKRIRLERVPVIMKCHQAVATSFVADKPLTDTLYCHRAKAFLRGVHHRTV